jgi:hypothetical protein
MVAIAALARTGARAREKNMGTRTWLAFAALPVVAAGLGVLSHTSALILGRALDNVLAQAQAQPGVRCGLGPPPNAPDFAAWNARREQETRERGYELVCDANLSRYDIPWKMRTLGKTRLEFEPVDLARTPFAALEARGNQVETITGKRSRLYRRFGLPDGRVVVLSEHDLSADHIHTWRDPKDEPERIGTLPARLVVLQTPSGKAVSSLTWLEGRRDYELWVDANAGVDRALRERMFTLAASLPPSKPACPNEAPYTPVPLGPDGFPQDGPAPKVLTSADIDAIDHPPCN